MKKIYFLIVILILPFVVWVLPANAQQPQPYNPSEVVQFLQSTISVEPAIENAAKVTMLMHSAELDPTLYYLISDVVVLPENKGIIVSVLGVNEPIWTLERNLVWASSIYLYNGMDGQLWGDICNPPEMECEMVQSWSIEQISLPQQAATAMNDTQTLGAYAAMSEDLPQLQSAAQFITDPTTPLIWPWKPGMSAQYGVLGVHASGFNSYIGDGFSAIDIVGGEGESWTENAVYAMHDMRITSVCNDGTSKALILWTDLQQSQNAPHIDQHIIYAHLDPSQSFYNGDMFIQGDYVGSLVPGNFSDSCGTATHAANQWHLHLGFPDIGRFVIADCALDTGTEVFTCSDGNTYSATDDLPSSTSTIQPPKYGIGANVWDWIIQAFVSVVDQFVSYVFPDAKSAQIFETLASSGILAIDVAYTLAGAFINLSWPITCLVIILGISLFMGPFALLRAIYKSIPAAG